MICLIVTTPNDSFFSWFPCKLHIFKLLGTPWNKNYISSLIILLKRCEVWCSWLIALLNILTTLVYFQVNLFAFLCPLKVVSLLMVIMDCTCIPHVQVYKNGVQFWIIHFEFHHFLDILGELCWCYWNILLWQRHHTLKLNLNTHVNMEVE